MASLKQERQRLDPRHVRKIAENERRLGPLLKLDRWLEIQVGEVDKAYKKTREIGCEGEGSSQPYEMGHI
jgi:hypothetical protein